MSDFEDIQLRQVPFDRQEKKIVNLDSKEEFPVDRIRLNVPDPKPSTNEMKMRRNEEEKRNSHKNSIIVDNCS